jgi:SET domain-containing protein
MSSRVKQSVIVKETVNKGKGVFALIDFKKDDFILRVEGRIIETEAPALYPKDVQNHWYPFERKGNKRLYVYPKLPWKYLNHSCNPNAGIINNRDIVAMKKIRKGEEITIDYSMNNVDGWKMKCKCGNKNCRKTISTFWKLDKATQKKYLNYVIDCIREEYNKQQKKQ